MKKFRLFLGRHRNAFLVLSLAFFCLGFLSACGLPQWIATAQAILPIAANMALGVLSLIAALSGKTLDPGEVTTLNTVIGAIQAALSDLDSMVQEYNANPSTTLLGEIEAGAKAVIDNINKFLADTGITDKATGDKIVAVLQLVLEEVTSWASLLPLLSAKFGEHVSLTVPMSSKEFKSAYNAIISVPTGNTSVDAALTHLKRL